MRSVMIYAGDVAAHETLAIMKQISSLKRRFMIILDMAFSRL